MLLLLAACNDQDFARREETDTFSQAPSNEVDILWVVDNSHSMSEEQASVSAGAGEFVGNLEATGMDFHLGVVTTDVDASNVDAGALLGNPPVLDSSLGNYEALFKSRVLVSTGGSDQEKGLQAAITALTPPLTNSRNVGFLRPDAMLSIVILSDENDCSDDFALGSAATGEDCYTRSEELTPVTDLAARIRDIKDDPSLIKISGIIGPEVLEGCENTVFGKRYSIAITAFAGVSADICEADYSKIMDRLGLIATGMLDTFNLSHIPDAETIEVWVLPEGGTEYQVPDAGPEGYTYVDDPTAPRIFFAEAAIPPRAALISVTYDIAGEIQEPDTSG